MDFIVEMVDKVISNIENEEVIANAKAEVNKMMKDFPMFAW